MNAVRKPRSILILALALILAAAIYGFAAANVVPETGAGDGSGNISGYTISNVDYTLDGADPGQIVGVAFDVDSTSGTAGAPSEVHITLNGGSWVSCTNTSGSTWSCTVSVTVASASSLRVVAVE
jgi:hypothetical protein